MVSEIDDTQSRSSSPFLSLHNNPYAQPADTANYAEQTAYGCPPKTSRSTSLCLPSQYTSSDQPKTDCPHDKDGIHPNEGDIDPSEAKNLFVAE